MDDERLTAIRALLTEAEAAHGTYETNELGGVYDREWAPWYAGYLVDHGIGRILGHDMTVPELGTVLARSFAAFEQLEPPPADGWADYLARSLVSAL